MHLIFFRTSDVFEAEEILKSFNILTEIVPTPVLDKAYCGVCLKIREPDYDFVTKYLNELEYIIVL